jgi:hypothetical protein
MENKPKSPVTVEVMWQQHEKIRDIDKFVETVFPPPVFGSYFGAVYARDHATNFKEFKEKVITWAKGCIGEYEDLIAKVEQLPDEEDRSYLLEIEV